DASRVGIGAVIVQRHDSLERIVSFYSRTLSAAERNYSGIELELLAIVDTLKENDYIFFGIEFTIVTDSKALTYLHRLKELNSRLARWALLLQRYKFKIVYRKGKDNILCDYISRHPLPSQYKISNTVDTQCKDLLMTEVKCEKYSSNEAFCVFNIDFAVERQPLTALSQHLSEHFCLLNNISMHQQRDSYLSLIIKILKGEHKGMNKSLRKAASLFELKNGILYRTIIESNEFKNVTVIPKRLIPNVLAIMHDSLLNGGHLGVRRTFEKTRERFWWKTMFKDCLNWVASCNVCNKVKPHKSKSAELKPIEPGSRPMSQIGLDIVGMLPRTTRGNRFIIVVTCYLSKYAITKAVKHVTAKDVAEFLLNDVILKFSAFETLISDNGVQFRSNLIKELNILMGAHHKFTTPYKPSTAGLVERVNRSLMTLLKSYVEKESSKWDIVLPFITHMYNVSFHSSINTTPFYLLHGYHAKLPVDMYLNNNITNVNDCSDYIYEVSVNLQKAREEAKEHITAAQENYKKYYDKRHKPYEFHVGDKCYVNYPIRKLGESNKFKYRWIGPFTVIHKINSLVYEVESVDEKLYFDRININKMRPCVVRNEHLASTQEIRRSPRLYAPPKYYSTLMKNN
ncbi:pol polyprotein-like protein, partial [Leptotrombidium deliense]